MLLPRTAEYALRAMACIAAAPEGQPKRAKDIAGVADVPPHFLSKILRQLVSAGLLTSRKGHQGGFVLARPAETIRVREVLDAVGFETGADHCVFGWGKCNADEPCPLHPAWLALSSSWKAWADGVTLSLVSGCGPIPESRRQPDK